jgi:hypothetical protein
MPCAGRNFSTKGDVAAADNRADSAIHKRQPGSPLVPLQQQVPVIKQSLHTCELLSPLDHHPGGLKRLLLLVEVMSFSKTGAASTRQQPGA